MFSLDKVRRSLQNSLVELGKAQPFWKWVVNILENGVYANFLFQWSNKRKRKKGGSYQDNRSEKKKKFESQGLENTKRVPSQNSSKLLCGKQQTDPTVYMEKQTN